MKIDEFKTRFVDGIDFIPDEGVMYYSKDYSYHSCPCGCKIGCVIPVDDLGWTSKLNVNNSVTIEPSISRPGCGSHYKIKNNKVVWYK